MCAESVADSANKHIEQWAQENGFQTSRRFSPGYGTWPLEEQRYVFSLLGGEPAGVKLTPGCMMIPRKSVSFAVRIGDPGESLTPEDVCAICGLKHCYHKKADR